ncbi:MAG: sigma-70 family RNA polymerase sigma factor, partial [Acidobacteriota bacterium]
MARNVFFSQAAAAAPVEHQVSAEAQLVERAASGDTEAFGEIYKAFAPLIHGFVLSRVPYDDVNDIVQEVFLAAYKNLDGLRDKDAVGAWLATIARNHAAEYYRRAKPTEELPEDLSGKHNPNSEALEILKTIRSMPETYRETLILRLIEGM